MNPKIVLEFINYYCPRGFNNYVYIGQSGCAFKTRFKEPHRRQKSYKYLNFPKILFRDKTMEILHKIRKCRRLDCLEQLEIIVQQKIH